jgi:hypothetical protein
MLDIIVSSALDRSLGSAIVDMDVPTKRLAHQIAHHRRPIVIRREPSTFDLETFFVWAINGPSYV